MWEKLKNPFLQTYLEYVEDTETPMIMHLWCAISGGAACLGRRVTFPFGIKQIFGNQYILLIGPPGVRKSTAISILEKRLRASTSIRFAPTDTGGQRQGLITAIQNPDDDEDYNEMKNLDTAEVTAEPEKLNCVNFHIGDPRDQHTIYAVASEFATFIGHGDNQLQATLIKLWDGEDVDYKLKNTSHVLKEPLLNILGATTPTSIAESLPPTAMGQGFMSRFILVFANQKHKRVARPKELDQKLGNEIERCFSQIFYRFDGEMNETERAKKLLDEIYADEVKINDTRFIHYVERRHDHLIKLSMTLAALRQSMTIEHSDIFEAHEILKATEIMMPESLGEFGLSQMAAAKQRMVEFLSHATKTGPVTQDILWAVMQKDMKLVDFYNSLHELVNAGKIIQVNIKDPRSGKPGVGYIYNDKDTKRMEEALQSLMDDEEHEDHESG